MKQFKKSLFSKLTPILGNIYLQFIIAVLLIGDVIVYFVVRKLIKIFIGFIEFSYLHTYYYKMTNKS